jgi:hypothetical protein
MEHEDDLKMHREIIKIEGDRNLYNYTFELPKELKEETQEQKEPENA